MSLLKIDWKQGKDWAGQPALIAQVDFGIKDKRGREVGVYLIIRLEALVLSQTERETVTDANGTYQRAKRIGTQISVIAHQTRNQELFGGSTSGKEGLADVEAAKADAEKRALVSFNKVQARAGASET